MIHKINRPYCITTLIAICKNILNIVNIHNFCKILKQYCTVLLSVLLWEPMAWFADAILSPESPSHRAGQGAARSSH